jgi:hypothetical protein
VDSGNLYVRRDDYSLERLPTPLDAGEPMAIASGDAWDTEQGSWLTTDPREFDGKDQLKLTAPDGSVRQTSFASPLTAAALLDPLGDEVVVAETPEGGISLLSVFRWP